MLLIMVRSSRLEDGSVKVKEAITTNILVQKKKKRFMIGKALSFFLWSFFFDKLKNVIFTWKRRV